MSWRDDWNRLSTLVGALLEGSGRFLPVNSNEYTALLRDVVLRSRKIFTQLEAFQRIHGKTIPKGAAQTLEEFMMLHGVAFREALPAMSSSVEAMTSLSLLASLRAELDDLLKDRETIARSLVNRAFAHLQRSIVSDASIRKTWRGSFDATRKRRDPM